VRHQRQNLHRLQRQRLRQKIPDYVEKIFDFEIPDAEKEKLKAAEDAGQHIYGMTVYIQKECLLKAARAFLVFKAVEEFGQIIVYNPTSQEIEDENFDC